MQSAVFFSLLSVLLAYSGVYHSGNSSMQQDGDSIDNNLIFKNEYGQEIQMPTDYTVYYGICDPGYIDEYALKIIFHEPSDKESLWRLVLMIDDIAVDTTYSFPNDGSLFTMFIFDAGFSNELASNTTVSSGIITIDTLDCDSPIRVSFTINASIGSEFWDGPPVHVSGDFSCTLY